MVDNRLVFRVHEHCACCIKAEESGQQILIRRRVGAGREGCAGAGSGRRGAHNLD